MSRSMEILKVKTDKRKLGDFGERRAASYLFWRGYRILERNYVSDGTEVDLICVKGDTLVFVEVKTRTLGSESLKEPRPASAVTPEKMQKIFRVASYYKAHKHTGKRMRFDIVEVLVNTGDGKRKVAKINHLVGAFDKDSAASTSFKRY